MSIAACAELVQTADPDRFAVISLASEQAQEVLYPLYAFNVEVSRAPWVTEEAMIAEMRLQWWRDALEEVRENKAVRGHVVTTALAQVLDAEGAMVLDKLIAARRWDIYDSAFATPAEFDTYIAETAVGLMVTAHRLLGHGSDITGFARAYGIAAFLRAVPELKAAGRAPLINDSAAEFERVFAQGQRAFEQASKKNARQGVVCASGWWLASFYKADPATLYTDGWRQSEFARRWGLLKLAFRPGGVDGT